MSSSMQSPELFRLWFAMADESLQAATLLEAQEFTRSSVSRYYYAAYQAITAVLLYRGVTLPVVDGTLREAWSHDDTPGIFVNQIERFVKNREFRRDVERRLQNLYEKRVVADYITRRAITQSDLQQSRKDAKYVVRVVEGMLPLNDAG